MANCVSSTNQVLRSLFKSSLGKSFEISNGSLAGCELEALSELSSETCSPERIFFGVAIIQRRIVRSELGLKHLPAILFSVRHRFCTKSRPFGPSRAYWFWAVLASHHRRYCPSLLSSVGLYSPNLTRCIHSNFDYFPLQVCQNCLHTPTQLLHPILYIYPSTMSRSSPSKLGGLVLELHFARIWGTIDTNDFRGGS